MLHALRLKGFAEDEAVAERACVPIDDARTELATLQSEGLVTRREGRLSGWALTSDGRATHVALLATELEKATCRPAVEEGYREFLRVNNQLLGVCTDWQMRTDGGEQALNDHTDPAYDAAVIARLAEIDRAVQPVCASLTECMDRFECYGTRLAEARRLIEAGDHSWFTKPLIDSYHTVWFELHEDLLVTLGIERGSEEDSEAAS